MFIRSLLLITFVLNLLLHANIENRNIDLYYANGIMMEESEQVADEYWRRSMHKLFRNNIDLRNKIYSYKVSYNASQGFFDDVFEALEQTMNNEWGWADFSGYFRQFIEKNYIQEGIDKHLPDLTEQVNNYKTSIGEHRTVVVIAHSQGNYYANEAYELLTTCQKEVFYMFGVATPANHIAGYEVNDESSPYVLFENDFINTIVTALPANRVDSRHHGFPSIDAHSFYDSYLMEETTKDDIKNFIVTQINELEYEIYCRKKFKFLEYVCPWTNGIVNSINPKKLDIDTRVEIINVAVDDSEEFGVVEIVAKSRMKRYINSDSGRLECYGISSYYYNPSYQVFRQHGYEALPEYDIGECKAHVFMYVYTDDGLISGNSIDYHAKTPIYNPYTCTSYQMSSELVSLLKAD